MSLRYRSSAYSNTTASLWPCDINYLKIYIWELIFTNGINYRSRRVCNPAVLTKGITYIGDRGYISFKLFLKICDKKAFFIIRGKKGILYNEIETLKTAIPDKPNINRKVLANTISPVGMRYKYLDKSFPVFFRLYSLINQDWAPKNIWPSTYGTICTSCRALNTNCLILLSGLRIMRRLFSVTSLKRQIKNAQISNKSDKDTK